MGVEYRAVIAVGAPYEDLKQYVEGLDELLDDGTLSSISPYFDAPYEDSIVGFIALQSDDYSWQLTTETSIQENIRRARVKWDSMFPNIMPSVVLMPYGW